MKAELSDLVGESALSAVLDAYFRALSERDKTRRCLGLLSEAESVARTQEFRAFHPVVRSLRGIVLDDPGTSDHHLVLCRNGVKGTVLHLTHDGTSRIVFDGIGSFLEAAHHCTDAGSFIDDAHPDHAVVLDDQAMLRSLIVLLRSEPDYGDIVPALVPSLELADLDFMSMLVGGDDV